MSLILDAINKASREVDDGERVPNLHTVHHPASPAGVSRRWLVLVGAITAILLSGAIVLLFVYLRNNPVSEVHPSVAEVQLEHITTVNDGVRDGTSPPIAKQSTAPRAKPPTTGENAQVQALYEVQGGEIHVQEPVVRPAQVEPRQTTIDEGLARSLWEESRTKPIPQLRPTPQVIEPEPLAAAPSNDIPEEVDFDSTMAAFESVPFLHELPQAKQDAIPTLMYAQHLFDQQKVVLNKKTFFMGDTVARDLMIERILADGVLLNYKGEQFKLAALSSWVNY